MGIVTKMIFNLLLITLPICEKSEGQKKAEEMKMWRTHESVRRPWKSVNFNLDKFWQELLKNNIC